MASPFFINESDVIGVTRGFAIALVSRVTHWCLLIQHSLGFHRHIIGGSLRFFEIRWMQSINIFRVVVILLDVKKNSLWRFSGTLWGVFCCCCCCCCCCFVSWTILKWRCCVTGKLELWPASNKLAIDYFPVWTWDLFPSHKFNSNFHSSSLKSHLNPLRYTVQRLSGNSTPLSRST